MTGEQLRTELERIAGRAPTVDVADDLFDRGRRSAARARVLVVGAVVACLALMGGVAFQVTRTDEAPVADGESGGVPDHIYAPPDGALTDPLDRILAWAEVGPAAAVYATDSSEAWVVVVTPGGRYRQARLPDRYEPMLDDVGPVLSPDGRRLAYLSEIDRIRRISVLDLVTGDLRHVDLGGDLGATVRTVQWSPNGRWLAWSGQLVRSRTANGASYRSRIVGGVIAPRATRSRTLPRLGSDSWDGPGICDDGTVLRYEWPTLLDGDRRRSWPSIVADHGPCSAPHSYLREPLGPGGSVLGWLPAGPGERGPTAVVLRPDRVNEPEGSIDRQLLQLVDSHGDVRQVGTVESAWVTSTTVATGMMTAERPTVPAGSDPWAEPFWQEHPVATAVIAVILGGPLLGGLALWWRARRRTTGAG